MPRFIFNIVHGAFNGVLIYLMSHLFLYLFGAFVVGSCFADSSICHLRSGIDHQNAVRTNEMSESRDRVSQRGRPQVPVALSLCLRQFFSGLLFGPLTRRRF